MVQKHFGTTNVGAKNLTKKKHGPKKLLVKEKKLKEKGPFTDGSTKHFWLPFFYFYTVWANFLVLWGKWVLLCYPRITGHETP